MRETTSWTIYGQEYGLVMSAGSDNHCGANWPLYGVAMDHRLTDIQDYVKAILSGKQMELLIPEGRLIMPEAPVIDERHKAYMLDDEEQDVPTTKEWTE